MPSTSSPGADFRIGERMLCVLLALSYVHEHSLCYEAYASPDAEETCIHVSYTKLILAIILTVANTVAAVVSRMSAILLSQSSRDEQVPGEESIYVFVTLFLIVISPKLMMTLHSGMLYVVREFGFIGRHARERFKRALAHARKVWSAESDIPEKNEPTPDAEDAESEEGTVVHGGFERNVDGLTQRSTHRTDRIEEAGRSSVSCPEFDDSASTRSSTALLSEEDTKEEEEDVGEARRSLYSPIVKWLRFWAVVEACLECTGHILLVYFVFSRVSIPNALISVDCFAFSPLVVVVFEKFLGPDCQKERQLKVAALCGFSLQLTTLILLVYRDHTVLHGGAILCAVVLSSAPLLSNFVMGFFFSDTKANVHGVWLDAMEDSRYSLAVLKSVLSVCIIYPLGIFIVANRDYHYSLGQLAHAFAAVLTNTSSGNIDVSPYFWLFIFALCSVMVLFYTVWFSVAVRLSLTAFIIPMTLTTSVCITLRSTLCSMTSSHQWLSAKVFDPLGISDSYACDEKREFYSDAGDMMAWLCGTAGIVTLLFISFRVSSSDKDRHSVFQQRLNHLRPEREIFHTFHLSSIGTDQILLLNQRTVPSHYAYYKNSANGYKEMMNMPLGPTGTVEPTGTVVDGNGYENITVDPNGAKTTVRCDNDIKPHTFICITMWRESVEEMKGVLKSVTRLLKAGLPSTFEVHIVLDSAFKEIVPCYDRRGHKGKATKTKRSPTGNSFVRQLLALLREMKYKSRGCPRRRPVFKQKVHGGTYAFTLDDVSLYVHLKDTSLVKQRKRSSQLMYFLDCHRRALKHLKTCTGSARLKQFYVLTLDGDVGFEPSSVNWLLNLLKTDARIAGACGRLYPVGTGVLTAWQKVEYAFGHWFQKVSEHVLGSVLCCPGCFSMFRLHTVYSVLEDYCVEPKTPNEYVQFEQGEDRYLSTLLIRQGYVLQYSSVATAFTHCPTDFKTFFHQRRRWITSTAANIMDMVSNQSEILENNGSIGAFFMGYVFALLVTTLLSPSTVVLVLTAGLNYGLGFKNPGAIILMTVVYLGYTCLCMYCASRKHWNPQLAIDVANYLGVPLSILMASVAVGVCIQLVQAIESPESIFILVLAGMFVFAALIHLSEWKTILLALLYLIMLPSMYLLLPVFAFVNMCTTLWGTREASANQKGDLNESEKKGKPKESDESTGAALVRELRYGIVFSIRKPFECIFGLRAKSSSDDSTPDKPSKTSRTEDKPDQSSSPTCEEGRENTARDVEDAVTVNVDELDRVIFEDEGGEEEASVEVKMKTPDQAKIKLYERYNLIPEALDESSDAPKTPIGEHASKAAIRAEIRRRQLLNKKEESTEELYNHRTTFVIGWTTLNLIWIIVVLEFAKHQSLHIKKWDNENAISFVFLSGFGVVLLIQLFAMVIHRLGTLIMYFSSLNVIERRKRHSSNVLNLTNESGQLAPSAVRTTYGTC